MARRSVFTHKLETIAPLHARYVAGEDPALLAAELGISRSALLCQFHHKGLGGRTKRHWWTQAELRASRDQIERGMSLEESARMLGVKSSALYRALLEIGYSAKQGESQKAKEKRDREDYRMYSLRREGMSHAQIATEIGWPDSLSGQRRVGARISKYCFRAGIPTPMVKEILRRDGTRRRVGYGDRVRRSIERRSEEAMKAAAEADGKA